MLFHFHSSGQDLGLTVVASSRMKKKTKQNNKVMV